MLDLGASVPFEGRLWVGLPPWGGLNAPVPFLQESRVWFSIGPVFVPSLVRSLRTRLHLNLLNLLHPRTTSFHPNETTSIMVPTHLCVFGHAYYCHAKVRLSSLLTIRDTSLRHVTAEQREGGNF